MPLNIDDLDQIKQVWLPLSGNFRGVDLLVKQATPREAERFRQQCMRLGVMKTTREGATVINTGREDDFFRMFAEKYVLDWRGDVKPEGTAYSADLMGRFLGSSMVLFELVANTVADDASFFGTVAGGSTPK